MTDREQLLRLADNIAAHGTSITYPSRQAAQEVRNVVRELAAALRATDAVDPHPSANDVNDDQSGQHRVPMSPHPMDDEPPFAPSVSAHPQAEPVAWTNEQQLGFLKVPAYADIPMAMWAGSTARDRIPLYAHPQAQTADVRDAVIEEAIEAARKGFEQAITKYVLIGPGGMAMRMINAIRALQQSPATDIPPTSD
jgi:hypothetical protein